MITVDGKSVRISHYRIPQAVVDTLKKRDLRLIDAGLQRESDDIYLIALATSVYEMKKAGIPVSAASNKGGFTVAEVVEKGTSGIEMVLATGIACCRADEQFNRKIGRDVAVGRALAQLRRNKPSLA